MTPLKYLSRQASDHLYDEIEDNLDLYRTGDFLEKADGAGNSIELTVKVDLESLKNLIKGKDAEAEITNSKLIWNVFNKLHPSLASENRLWTRLTHVECLEYSRFRWLSAEMSDDDLIKSIRTHFFANTQTKYRDDNAISRLWWNAYIAKMAAPDNQEQAMRTILKTADIRSNFVERSRTVSRPVIAAAIVRMMLSNAWITAKERNFREFMIALNRQGGGKVFELWHVRKIDEFMSHCFNIAKANAGT